MKESERGPRSQEEAEMELADRVMKAYGPHQAQDLHDAAVKRGETPLKGKPANTRRELGEQSVPTNFN